MKKRKTKKRLRGGASHPCPKCRGNTHVRITRRVDSTVLRDRECLDCGHIYSTRESSHGMVARRA